MSRRTVAIKCDDGVDVSDGYHTFGELYDHRCRLYMTLCRFAKVAGHRVWFSRAHSDGTDMPGWFVLGIWTDPGEQLTYHLPQSPFWPECNAAGFEHRERAPEFDGHTSADVVARLARLKP